MLTTCLFRQTAQRLTYGEDENEFTAFLRIDCRVEGAPPLLIEHPSAG